MFNSHAVDLIQTLGNYGYLLIFVNKLGTI